MNKKQKIIISITGILIVVLTLLGLTYAYYLTHIIENPFDKSIEVTTANLELTYGDGTGLISVTNMEPGYYVTKYFTATNTGTKPVQYLTVLENIVNPLLRKSDLAYTLECTSYLKSGFSLASDGTPTGTVDGTCEGASNVQFPSITSAIMAKNSIDITQVHYYQLKVIYKEMGENQNDDMGKTFSAKVNIANINDINPYSDNTESLAYKIVDNANQNLNGTKLIIEPLTAVGTEPSDPNERELSMTKDDYGMSYYFRGSVTNNYVSFNNMCFRIVRIQGDGSIKLLLANEGSCSDSNDNTGYLTTEDGQPVLTKYNSSGNGNTYLSSKSTDMKGMIESWFNTKFTDLSQLTQTNWCIDTSICGEDSTTPVTYGSMCRIAPSNTCDFLNSGVSAIKYKHYAASLTADEVWFAGGTYFGLPVIEQINPNLFIINNTFAILHDGIFEFTITPSIPDGMALLLTATGSVSVINMSDFFISPVIVLKSGVLCSNGSGTKNDPYVVNTIAP